MHGYVEILFPAFLLSACSYNVVCQDDISVKELNEYVQEKQWYEKACILHHRNDTRSVQKFLSTLTRLKNTKLKDRMKFHVHKDENVNVTFVKCFVKRSKPEVFSFHGNKTFYKWMKNLAINIPVDDELRFVDTVKMEKLQTSKEDTILIVCVPGFQRLSIMESVFTNVKKWNPGTTVYFVPPGTKVERLFVEEYNIEHFPSVLFFRRPGPSKLFTHFKTLKGEYEATEKFIQMNLLLHNMMAISIEKNTFETYLRNKQYVRTPALITIFSSADPRAHNYLHAFHRSYRTFGHDLNFFVLDISNQENLLVLSRHLQLHRVRSIPFTFCLHQSNAARHGIVQTLLETNGTPTPHVIQMFMRKINNSINNGSHDRFVHLSPELVHNQCIANETSICHVGDEAEETRKGQTSQQRRDQKKKRSTKRGDLKEITDATWEQNVLGSNEPNRELETTFSEKIDFKVKFVLVIFISGDCSYCQKVLPEFQKTARSAVYLENLSVFLMNCSKSDVVINKCKEYHVTGYPTLLLFRSLEAERSYERCFLPDALVEPSWIDYHGKYEAASILNWISEMKRPAMTIHSSVPTAFKDKNIKLIIKVFTKQYVSESLPRSLHGKVLHLSCLSILCEQLHSQLECVGVGDEGVKMAAGDQNLFVSTIEFWRQDGIRATLLRTGFPMDKSISMEAEQSEDSVFHEPHKYNIPAGFSCEDDHRTCVDVIKHFIRDHSRPPVTRVTQELFHTHKKGTTYMWDRPILLALAHQSNLTNSTSFYKELYNVAVQLYNKVNVAALDVDEHSYWASLFVPRGYYMNYQGTSEVRPLDRYPRFCLIHLNDHSRAAFYPRFNNALAEGDDFQGHVEGRLDGKEVLSFVDDYLKHEDAFTTESEHF